MLEIEKDFINDKMNLLGIKDHFPSKERYHECIKLLISSKIPIEEDFQNPKFFELH
jgi:hypothetical protein